MGNFKDFKVNDNSVFALNPDFITQPLSKNSTPLYVNNTNLELFQMN